MGERVRHKKRGTSYTVIDRHAILQTAAPLADGAWVVIYQGDDGQFWVRPPGEFYDGRFEVIPPAPAPSHGRSE